MVCMLIRPSGQSEWPVSNSVSLPLSLFRPAPPPSQPRGSQPFRLLANTCLACHATTRALLPPPLFKPELTYGLSLLPGDPLVKIVIIIHALRYGLDHR